MDTTGLSLLIGLGTSVVTAGVTAVTVAWAISGRLAKIEGRVDAHSAELTRHGTELATVKTTMAQNEQRREESWVELNRTLGKIEGSLEPPPDRRASRPNR